MPTTTRTTPPSLTERAQQNIRILKAIRRISDQAIADGAGFSSRQMVADRISGRTPIDLNEVELIAVTLTVEPMMLLGDSDALMRWVAENPDYEPPSKVKRRKPAPARKVAS
jgi:hypothetical protein